METKFVNFQVVEVTGMSREEAIEKAPFTVLKDATQAWKNFKKKAVGSVSQKDQRQFMLDYIAKNSKNAPGVGYSITLESAVADTRERPYKFENIKNEKGARKYKTIYQLKDAKTGEVIAETEGTKQAAKELAKSLYTENKYRGDLVCTYTKQVVEGEPTAFKVTYTPSKSSKVGSYLAFGIANN